MAIHQISRFSGLRRQQYIDTGDKVRMIHQTSRISWSIGPVVLGLGPVEDEVGHDEGRHHGEEGAPGDQDHQDHESSIGAQYLILQRVLGSPTEKTPAKAFCSWGEMWYLVVPRICGRE